MSLYQRDPAVLVEGHARKLAIVLSEVDKRHDDIVLGDTVGGESGGEEIDMPKNALDGGVPAGRAAYTHVLGDADALAGLEVFEECSQLGANGVRGRG